MGNSKDEKHLNSAEKQKTPLSTEVEPKELATKVEQAVFRHGTDIKNKPFRK
ncbi:hypothetical protein SAMN04487965_3690 [Microbulbifer donghaiensis]|uniref:Uncharacterized protein n=1 Tax=Microbulbifer donghaiensis TaxID=494016 RepID=A0A1M5IJM8_9GAMM|nr:hypothetical protein [Microbulbifer donghaiensis]SHG28554.1 hypothetical protein SAMN04487965_3690 [Microbulbifer donghaiensis]